MDLLKLGNPTSNSDGKSFLDNEEIYTNLKKVISSVISNRDAWPFREPVNEKEAPSYYEIIKSPMDLSIVSQKLENKIYSHFNQLECDLRLIVNNSETYNGEYNGFTTNAYSVWRNFRRCVKKYLNHDLSIEDTEAFIYPPRYNCTKKIAASVGKRKKRKKQKKSHKFQALELLYNATQDSIESTFQKFAFSPMSDNENKDDNLPKSYEFLSEEKHVQGFYNESFANLDNYSNLNGYYTEENRNENLVFKSLNEWNKQIDENGLSVVLPDKAVLCVNSPVEKNWLTNFPNDQPNYKTVFNKEMFKQPINGQLHNGQLILTQESVLCTKEKKKRTKNVKNSTESNDRTKVSIEINSLDQNEKQEIEDSELKHNSKKRLIIKLSKLNSDFHWKPIKNEESNESAFESDSSSDSSCSSGCSCESDN